MAGGKVGVMTQEASLYSLFSSFGLPAYPNIAVPDDAAYPYITYPVVSGHFADDAFLSVYLYTKNESVSQLTARVRAIGDRLKNGGETVDCDGGYVWLTTGDPWVNYMVDPDDTSVRFAVMNINVEFITTDTTE